MNATAALDGTHAYLVSPPQLAARQPRYPGLRLDGERFVHCTPAVAEGVVYAISGGALIASDAATGTQLFMFAVRCQALDYPPIAAGNRIVYASASGNVFAVSTSTMRSRRPWTASVVVGLFIASERCSSRAATARCTGSR